MYVCTIAVISHGIDVEGILFPADFHGTSHDSHLFVMRLMGA